ncbi:low temperature requirement protein A [Micromonospora okii]|uniref:low temperature requirement protein A n=1 Tax=Micromonospora okii TaxID=1182970 RepID=UPI001E3AC2C2|nr:low temperature requirement protein A [Micromonospora okii]
MRPVTEETRVTTAELFFDVVFVFAFIQVTTLMTDPAHLGTLRGLLVLSMLWWSWTLFAWLGNRVRADYGLGRVTLLVATPVMFVLAVNTREAFAETGDSVEPTLWFVVCFVAARVIYLAVRLYASPGLRGRDVAALTAPMVAGAALLLAAALLPRSALDPDAVPVSQVGLWALAVVVDYAAALALPVSERAVLSARHWAERHNLIIIVALGEVLVAVGLAGADQPNTPGLLVASALAVVVAGALEWIYFDLSALAGEHALAAATPARRVAIARSCYSYLHLPMIAGIILLALGLKQVPALSGVAGHAEPLDDLGRRAMYGGVVLFLVAHAAFQWQLGAGARAVVWPRLTAAALLLALLPLTARVSALWALSWLAAICLVTAATEFLVSRPQRRRLRATLSAEPGCATGGGAGRAPS